MSRKRNAALDFVAYQLVRGLSFLSRAASRKTALAIGSAVGWLGWQITKLSRNRIDASIENLRNLWPDAPRWELENILRRVFRHFGRFLLEMGRFALLDRGGLAKLVKFEGLENFTNAFARGKGVILATGHFGHFELANGALAVMGYPVWSVIRTVDNPMLDRLIDRDRCATGLGVIKKENSAGEILRHLRAGHVVTIAIDQNAGFNNIFVPFFGKAAATFMTPAVMGMRTGAPVLPVFCARDDAADTYTVRIHPPVELNVTGDRSADIRLAMTRISGTLEEAIRQAPEQWLWIHKRWKTRPGVADLEEIERDMEIIRSATNKTGMGTAANG
ncbi:MAG: lysophospholipid acyltransferase family protein [Nitrospinae bacterium]|nr:lysophospholipid acyltransferase family protein [Nitrospinota bacterium]